VEKELDGDTAFYTGEEWHRRGEDALTGSELILVTEGDLAILLNYDYDHPTVRELNELCAACGYWLELGHTWSVGFYPEA
jgi:hypothetical protein